MCATSASSARAQLPRAIRRAHGAGVLSAAAVVGLSLWAGERTARAAAYTITVDASKTASGLPHFWSGAVGTGTASLTLRTDLQTQYQLANRELGMLRVRGHGVLDDLGIFQWNGTGTPTYNWTNLDTYLSAIAAAGMRPLMELSFMPTSLARDGGSDDPPKDSTVYQNYIQAFVQHCVDKFGAADVGQWYWEVWNEPNYSGFWTGTFTDYLNLYDAAVAGATAVLPNILIGGPVTTSGSATQIQQFLQHTKSMNLRVAFASSHAYASGGGTASDVVSMVTDNTSRMTTIQNAGYTLANVQSINSEWNSSYTGQGGNVSDTTLSMDNHVNAPFIVKTIKLLSDQIQGNTPPVSIFSYWTVSDIFGEGSYIQNHNFIPFGYVFGLMNFQGVRKAAWNGFKMLSYLGANRLTATGGTGNADGVDAFAASSAKGDEVEIVVYDFYATVNTPAATDNVTLTVNNLPFSGPAYVTQFPVDSAHANPYAVWVSQGSPVTPTEAQWEAIRAAQHLVPAQAPTPMNVTGSYTASLTIPRQGAVLVTIGKSRPVTGRNAFVPIEGEDFDGQSAVTKEDSNDTSMGQSIVGNSGSFAYFENVDFSDGGVDAVQLRVNAQSNTTLELRADTQTGTSLGNCTIAATGGMWTTQVCSLTHTSGVHRLYVIFDGTAHLNFLSFTGSGDGGLGQSGPGGPGGTSPGTDGGGATSGSDGGSSQANGGGSSGGGGSGHGSSSGSGQSSGAGASSGAAGGSGGNGAAPSSSSSKSGCAVVSPENDVGGVALAFASAAALTVLRRRRRDH